MSKRSYSDVHEPPHKRAKYHENPAASLVLKHADELTYCLEALKSGNKSLADLRSVCRTLLPAFTKLANDINSEAEDDEGMVRDGYGNHPEPIPVNPETGTEAGAEAEAEVMRAPTFVMLTPWEPSQTPVPFPSLPPITDPALATAAFTHQGVCVRGDISYERLEWIGDAYLYIIASSFIYQTFPSLSPGRSSQLREQLVRNATLSEYATRYGFMDRARLPQDIRSMHNKDRTKILGDMVEAYTGAIILSDRSQGLERAAGWLKSMWSITLQDQLKKEFRSRGIDSTRPTPQPSSASLAGPAASSSRPPKEELANLIRVPGVTIRYEDMPNKGKDSVSGMPLLTVGVYVDGWGVTNERLGFGIALSKKEAGQKAAKLAIENKKAIKRWIKWKEEYVARNPPKPKPNTESR